MGSKVGCFVGFCHHPVTTTSAHMHAYHFCSKVEQNRAVNNHCMEERYKTNM